MFADAIEHIASGLNQHIKRQFSLSEDLVIVSNLINSEGQPASDTNNKLVITLVSVEKDATMQSANPYARQSSGLVSLHPALHVNLGILISANFSDSNYNEALKLLSAVGLYFQGQSVFDHNNTPDLPSEIQKFTVELENLSINDMSSLWSMIGSKHLASLFYKVRSIVIRPDSLKGRVTIVETSDISVRPVVSGANDD